MKRSEKIALLTGVFRSSSGGARKRLEQAVANAPRVRVIIDNLFYEGPPLTDTSLVNCHINGQHHTILLGEAGRYARRYGLTILVVDPIDPTP